MTEKTLISGGIVITVDEHDTIYRPGWVLIEGNIITQMGKGDPPPFEDVQHIDAKNYVVMPGIVNAHTHVSGTLFKALTEDDPDGFYGLALPMEKHFTPESVYLLSLLGLIETVKAGSTCINDIYWYMDATAKAVEQIQMRAVLAEKIFESDLTQLQYLDYTRYPEEARKKLQRNIDLIEKYHQKGSGRITCRFGPHATDTCSLELVQEIAELAEQYDVGVHTHAAQKQQEVDFLQETYGLSPIEFLVEAGIANERLVAAHCKLIDDEDLQILKDTGIYVGHCPTMHAKRGFFSPVKEMYDAKINLVLGTDWVNMDPWDNMRFAIGGARLLGVDIDTINAKKAFRMATIEAAKAVGLDHEIGSLEIGKKADIIMVNINQAHLQPMFDDVVATLVYNATGKDVEHVMIDGELIVEHGQLKTVQEQEVIKEATKIAHNIYHKHTGRTILF